MPIERQFLSDRVELALSGLLLPEAILGAFADTLDHPDLPEGGNLLIDVRASDTLPPTEAMKKIAAIIGSRSQRLGGRAAVVVAHDVRFGLARQLGAWLASDGIDVRPFRDRDAAVQWLDSERSQAG